jgi:hypothetical protein
MLRGSRAGTSAGVVTAMHALVRACMSPLPWPALLVAALATGALLLVGRATPAEAADAPAPAQLLSGVTATVPDAVAGAGQTLADGTPLAGTVSSADAALSSTAAGVGVPQAAQTVSRSVGALPIDAGGATPAIVGSSLAPLAGGPSATTGLLPSTVRALSGVMAAPVAGTLDTVATALQPAVDQVMSGPPAGPAPAVPSAPSVLAAAPGAAPAGATDASTTLESFDLVAASAASGEGVVAPAPEPLPGVPAPALPPHLPPLPTNGSGPGELSPVPGFGSASLAWTAMLAVLVALLASAWARLGSPAITLSSASLFSRTKRPG